MPKAYNNYIWSQEWIPLSCILKLSNRKLILDQFQVCKYGKSPIKIYIRKNNQVIENLVHKPDLKNNYLDEGKPWEGMLAATGVAVRRMYRTIL